MNVTEFFGRVMMFESNVKGLRGQLGDGATGEGYKLRSLFVVGQGW